MSRETSRNYGRRPLPLRALNAAWGALGTWSQPRVDADVWFRAAGAASDWDPEPFEVLARSLRDEARLTPLGRTITTARIVGALRARRNVEALGPPPALPDRPAPIVVVGLQRTGTTLLQRLLAALPGHRGLASWEALNPGPWPGERSPHRRIQHARRAAGAVRWLAPDFVAAHPVEPLQPEEEVVLFEHVGLSTGFEATYRVPSYARWLEAQDQTPAYAWLTRVLAHLEPDPTLRGVLKTPHHLEFLPELLAALPDAHLVWTHRDARATLPSFCSMVAHGTALCTDHVDAHAIGAHWLRKTTRMWERATAFRLANPSVPVLDIDYDELVADPVATVARVVAFAGGQLDDAAEAAARSRLANSPRHKYGRHVYAATDFGLQDQALASAYA
ncbi:MAG: sulfotransferase [Myxococcota bacterium]